MIRLTSALGYLLVIRDNVRTKSSLGEDTWANIGRVISDMG